MVDRHLCGRCGSTQWVEISATEIQCGECGLGSTRTVLTFTKSDDEPSPAAMREREQLLAQHRGAMRDAFANASFQPYGLDAQWAGLRWFGGWGGSSGMTSRLELAHGDDPYDQTLPIVRVETVAHDSRPRGLNLMLLARRVVHHFHAATGTLDEEVRASVFGGADDPFGGWSTAEFVADGNRTDASVMRHGDHWAAAILLSEVDLAIQARGWPIEQTGIVQIEDLGPYARGSEQVHR